MTSHLSQVVAVEKDVKEKASQSIDHAKRQFGEKTLLAGIAKTYTPKDELGEQLPSESKRIQVKVKDELTMIQTRLVDLLDVVATKDCTNCVAKADVFVDGAALLKGIPATYLLFLEKQLGELASFVKSIPVLDPAEQWEYNKEQDCYATLPIETVRTKKDKKSQVAFEGNQHHPPQFIVWDEDVEQGRYKTVKYSGAMPSNEVHAISTRIEKLQRAVKFAREEANRSEAKQQEVGASLLHYIFG